MPIEDLLQPVELQKKQHARDVIARMERAADSLETSVSDLLVSYIEWVKIRDSDPELSEFVDHRLNTSGFWPNLTARIANLVGNDPELAEQVSDAVQTISVAGQYAAIAAVDAQRSTKSTRKKK